MYYHDSFKQNILYHYKFNFHGNQFSEITWLQTKSNIEFLNVKCTLKDLKFNVAQSIRTYINSCHISVCCFKSRNFTTLNRHLKQRDKF